MQAFINCFIDRKKKKGDAVEIKYDLRLQDNSLFRTLGSWKEGPYKQTDPPSIPIVKQFPDGKYPIGEIQEYQSDLNRKRITDAEFREKERLFHSDYEALRKAAECHR